MPAQGMMEAVVAPVRTIVRASAGNVAMLTAIAAPAVMGVIGIAADYANFASKSAVLQSASDEAAIAAAKQLAITSSTDAAVIAAAKAFVAQSVPGNIDANVAIDRGKAAVSIQLTEKWTPFFAHFLGAKITPIVTHAEATLTGQANICMLTLDTAASAALQLTTGARVTTNGCGVFSNSSDTASVKLKNASKINSPVTCTVGGYDVSGGTITPSGVTDCPAIEDPLASRTAPPIGSCTQTNLTVSGGTVTLNPGRYCGGLTITGNADVTFAPGNYVISGDKFKISGTARVAGTNVAFFLKGDEAEINFVGDTTVNLSGAESGPMAGLLFFGDPTADETIKHRINSKYAGTMTGTIYLPHGALTIDPAGGQVAQNSAYTAIITKKLTVSGGPELVLNSDYAATNVPVPAGIQATSDVVLSQ